MPTKNQAERILVQNEEMFDPAIWNRGLLYYREGRVSLTFCDGKEVHADVRGSSKYSVRLDFSGISLKKAKCNCPYDRGLCKHEAASLIAFAYSDYIIEETIEKPSLSDAVLTQRQFVSRVNLLLAREYNINPERFYRTAVAVYEAGLPNLSSSEKVERFALIFFLAANSKIPERGGQGAHWLIKLTQGRGFTDLEKARIVLKLAESFAYSSYLYELFLSEEYRVALGIAFALPRNSYDYPFTRFFTDKYDRVIPNLTEKELASLLEPSLRFPYTDLVIRRLSEIGKLEETLSSFSDEELANLGMRDVDVAVSLSQEKPDLAKRILLTMFDSYNCDFKVIYYLYALLSPEEKRSMSLRFMRKVDYLNLTRAFSILRGEAYTPGSVKYLNFSDLMLLSDKILADHGDKVTPYAARVIRKHASTSLYVSSDFKNAFDALKKFNVPPAEGLLSPEFIQASYLSTDFRIAYLAEVKEEGLFRELGLRRYEI